MTIPSGADIVNILKWGAITILTTAVTGQQVGWVQPAWKAEAEAAMVASIQGDALAACHARNDALLERLMACIETCE